MSENAQVTVDHLCLCRCALVYVRQSSAAQVEYNRESTERQYRLVHRAIELGWALVENQAVLAVVAAPGYTGRLPHVCRKFTLSGRSSPPE